MRDKVLAAIEIYAAGGTITNAIALSGLKSVTPFYATIRKEPEVMALYEAAIKVRSYVMLDEAYEIGSDKELDAKKARAMAEIRLKIAGLTNPDRFGDRVNVQHEIKPSLSGAIADARARAALPGRDLAQIIDVQAIDITPQISDRTSDKQSAALEKPTDAALDPFEEP